MANLWQKEKNKKHKMNSAYTHTHRERENGKRVQVRVQMKHKLLRNCQNKKAIERQMKGKKFKWEEYNKITEKVAKEWQIRAITFSLHWKKKCARITNYQHTIESIQLNHFQICVCVLCKKSASVCMFDSDVLYIHL